jgi:hypothetical protein
MIRKKSKSAFLTKKQSLSLLIGLAIIFSLAGYANAISFKAAQASDTLIVLPARPRVVELAFDLAAMRPLTLVSFRGTSATAEPLIHVWKENEWQYVNFADFYAFKFLSRPPKLAIIIGDDETVPRTILEGRPWPSRTVRVPTVNLPDLLNGLNPFLKLSAR